jgi:hypothetical protein
LNQLQKKVRVGVSSRHEERGRSHVRRDNYRGSNHSRSVSRTHIPHHSHFYSTRKAHLSEESQSIPKVSPIKNQRRRHELDNLQGELRKLKPPFFDGENKKGEEAKS